MSEAKYKTYPVATIATAIVLLAMIGTGGFFFHRCSKAPEEIIDAGTDALEKLGAAINTKTIYTDYTSTATSLSGSNRLQVAEINQTEFFRKSDNGTIIGIPLPEVVISANAPVNYVYHVDLNGKWEFNIVDRLVSVTAPRLSFNKPSIDVSKLKFEVKGSVLRDEEKIKDALVQEISPELRRKGLKNVDLVREVARREVENFVRSWLGQQYGVDDNIRVEVLFEDELPESDTEVRL